MRLRSLALLPSGDGFLGKASLGCLPTVVNRFESRGGNKRVGQLTATSIQHDCILLDHDDMFLTHSRFDDSSPSQGRKITADRVIKITERLDKVRFCSSIVDILAGQGDFKMISS